MGLSRREQQAKDSLYDIGYKYLCDNFHKFSQANKIKIALEIVKKAMPYQLEHRPAGVTTFLQEVIRRSQQQDGDGAPVT
jgi:hypothetical protein